MAHMHVYPGVFLIEIQGVYLLVSNREARKRCRYVCRINDTAAYLWKLIEKGLSFEEILACFSEKYDIDDKAALEQDIRRCITLFESKGYIC